MTKEKPISRHELNPNTNMTKVQENYNPNGITQARSTPSKNTKNTNTSN